MGEREVYIEREIERELKSERVRELKTDTAKRSERDQTNVRVCERVRNKRVGVRESKSGWKRKQE